MNSKNDKSQINIADIKLIALKKIYFGHQSVGYNMIDALKSIVPADAGLLIKETDNPVDFNKAVFAHSQNGENLKPETKIKSFVQKMDSGLGNKVEIAFFKFCYVDVTLGTDVNKIFSEYKNAMDLLINKYPKTKFLHFTVPVTAEDHSVVKKIKNLIKTMIGKNIYNDFADNLKRMEYNSLLKKEYGSTVFDLALIESTDKSGNVILSEKGGVKHHALMPYYTEDGGHLNVEGGRKVVLNLLGYIRSYM